VAEQIWNVVVQGGFAGFAVALLFVVIWLIRKLLDVLRTFQRVIEVNTRTMSQLTDTLERLRERLMERPCLLYKQTDKAE